MILSVGSSYSNFKASKYGANQIVAKKQSCVSFLLSVIHDIHPFHCSVRAGSDPRWAGDSGLQRSFLVSDEKPVSYSYSLGNELYAGNNIVFF
jgi:hypothetical protein